MLNRNIQSLCFLFAVASATASCSIEQRTYGGGSGGGSSSGSVDCSKPQDEQCFDGLDNDCNGKTDCADEACLEGAVCVDSPAGAELGVVVGADDPCPDGTAVQIPLLRGIIDTGCEGCPCTPDPTKCNVDLWFYSTETECANDVDLTIGKAAGPMDYMCAAMPIAGTDVYGGRTKFSVGQSCGTDPTTNATPAPAGWTESKKLCRAPEVGAGCDSGKVCVPKQPTGTQCALVTGSAACEGYDKVESDWFTGYSDSRVCGACSCAPSGGGGCDGVSLYLGSDWSCIESVNIKNDTKWCGQIYSPMAFLVGTPAYPTCVTDTKPAGSLDPTGQSTLCCL